MDKLLVWGAPGAKDYELGVDQGVLFVIGVDGPGAGVAWNGLVGVTEAPAGAEPTKVYADNGVYGVLMSNETLTLTLEHLTAPVEFYPCDGVKDPTTTNGVIITGQPRSSFAFAYRTKIGDDTTPEKGYKIHIVFNCKSGVAEKAYKTIGDAPEVITFSRTLTATPVMMADGVTSTSQVVLDTRYITPAGMAAVEAVLYGLADAPGTPAALPTPDEIVAMCEPVIAVVAPGTPSVAKGTNQSFTCRITGTTTAVPCDWDVYVGNPPAVPPVAPAKTIINDVGKLFVAADEAEATLTVVATPHDINIAPVTSIITVPA